MLLVSCPNDCREQGAVKHNTTLSPSLSRTHQIATDPKEHVQCSSSYDGHLEYTAGKSKVTQSMKAVITVSIASMERLTI